VAETRSVSLSNPKGFYENLISQPVISESKKHEGLEIYKIVVWGRDYNDNRFAILDESNLFREGMYFPKRKELCGRIKYFEPEGAKILADNRHFICWGSFNKFYDYEIFFGSLDDPTNLKQFRLEAPGVNGHDENEYLHLYSNATNQLIRIQKRHIDFMNAKSEKKCLSSIPFFAPAEITSINIQNAVFACLSENEKELFFQDIDRYLYKVDLQTKKVSSLLMLGEERILARLPGSDSIFITISDGQYRLTYQDIAQQKILGFHQNEMDMINIGEVYPTKEGLTYSSYYCDRPKTARPNCSPFHTIKHPEEVLRLLAQNDLVPRLGN